MPHTYESPELGEVKKDTRGTLIEAQREYIEYLETAPLSKELEYKEVFRLSEQIQAAEKAIKGG